MFAPPAQLPADQPHSPGPAGAHTLRPRAWGRQGWGRGLAWRDGQDEMKLDRSPEYRERASLENLCDENFIGTGNGKALALGYE